MHSLFFERFQFLHSIIVYGSGCIEKEDGSETSYSVDCYNASGSGKSDKAHNIRVGSAANEGQFCHSCLLKYYACFSGGHHTHTHITCIGEISDSSRSFKSDSSSDSSDSTGTTG